ncbi:RAN GTPase-activating protein 1-like [Raphanus sativus]|uniref:RAN GTPase-activating protein 1-like n=1 Tax=Raphanus sativus TaxID=3726 RepID=A0A9W3DNJ8_RAPSA|nr:RAN GTPase-activating protein 1-like [Raphanus sativus]XP_056865393.1 RAN GTPase-activating protein 1-like [Raphanus sativus]XP_056865394.1 RAN GTPase-activating protein 1-like [Raphanus sativus]
MDHRSVKTTTPTVITVKMWPPSKSTRLMLVERMTNNLSTPSIFSRKYGLLTPQQAQQDANRIEDLAFSSANKHFQNQPDGDDGTSAVQIYAKESSKLMLQAIKRGPKGRLFDLSGGRRAFIDEAEARELLRPLADPTNNSYTKIRFTNRSFGSEAAKIAVTVLSSIKHQLREVDLSDFVAGRPEAEAIEVMNMFSSALEGSKLRYLDLSDNALGEKGIRAFASLIKSQRDLEELYLMNDGISEDAARAVRELLPSTAKIRVLQFHNNMTGDEGAVAIAEIVNNCPCLEDFRCSSTRIGSEGGVALAEALESCGRLKKLDLRDNMFGVEGGIALGMSLSVLSELTEIYMSYLNLEDEGTEALSEALINSAPSLRVLELAGNDITVESTGKLADCIASKQCLSKLNLSENELKDEGTVLIAKALDEGHDQLAEVDMSTNMMRRAGARALAQTVLKKQSFKLLNINGNFISEEGVDEVNDMFKDSPDKLGLLDDNDPDGEEDFEDEDEEEDSELEAKLGGLKIKQEEE